MQCDAGWQYTNMRDDHVGTTNQIKALKLGRHHVIGVNK